MLPRLVREGYRKGEYLYYQGDANNGIYILVSGTMSTLRVAENGAESDAEKDTKKYRNQSRKKYSAGAVIGVRSFYSSEMLRTESVFAETSSVVYYLDPEKLENRSIMHELAARSLGDKLDTTNQRLNYELS